MDQPTHTDTSSPDGGRERPVERFKPTTGAFAGYAGLAMAALALGYCLLSLHTVVGLRIGLGALFAAVVVWASQLRPRAVAYDDRVLLRGPLRDVEVPYLAVEEVTVTQMLNVWAGGRRYVCVGIGRPIMSDVRQRARKERQSNQLGRGRLREFSEMAEAAQPDQTAMSYQTFVVTRLEELVDRARRDARRDGRTGEVPPVVSRPALPEIVAMTLTGLAFAVSLVVS
jgi:hypothetical protein